MLQTPPYFTQLLTMKQLNSQQRDELIEQYVEIVVDSLDHQSLYELATENMTDYCDKLTDSELKEEISLTYDDELYAELVDNITSTDPVVYNTNGGQS